MAAYHRVCDSRRLQADCQEPGISSGTLRSVIEYGLAFTFYLLTCLQQVRVTSSEQWQGVGVCSRQRRRWPRSWRGWEWPARDGVGPPAATRTRPASATRARDAAASSAHGAVRRPAIRSDPVCPRRTTPRRRESPASASARPASGLT